MDFSRGFNKQNFVEQRISEEMSPDISKSIQAVVDIIEQTKPDIIEKCWSKSGLIGSVIDDVNEPEEFSTMFEAQLIVI